MNLIAPANLAFALLGGTILLLYVLRLKRKERIVSSTLLWQSALRDLQANAPWQKLRSSLLMWLQLAFVLLATFALMRPSILVQAAGGQTMAIILDASGSMAATDVAPSRFEHARSEAGRLINALGSGDGAILISAGAQTRVLASLTSDKNALKRALAGARTQDTGCNLREAIVLANSLLRGKRNPRLYILSDGAVPPLDDAASKDVSMQFVRIGQRNDNIAITAMDVRRGYGEGTNPQIYATIRNFSPQRRSINLEVSHDGNLVAVRPLTIEAGGQSEFLEDATFSQGLFGLRFDSDDDLSSDNAAYATLAPPRALKVLLFSDGNLFLEKALHLDPNVQLSRASGNAFPPAKDNDYDIIVCDGIAPSGLPPSNQLVFNAITDAAPVTKTGTVQAPGVADYDRKHPVARYAPWNDLRIRQTMAVTTKAWGQPIVEAERTPLIVAGERGGKRIVWCGFDLRDTDLPLRVAFPIFITNALQWLSSARDPALGEEGAARQAGDTIALDPPPGSGDVTITAPDKTTQRLPATTPLLFSGADRAGIYTASTGNGKGAWTQAFAVNLLSKSESDLQPRDALQMSGGKPVAAVSSARANQELWGYLALAALALLGLEWWVYHRGV